MVGSVPPDRQIHSQIQKLLMSQQNRKVRAIAHYLPQYHPIPENDEWWGKGFTEWTHVAKAKPLFRGHMQPRVPADLGFYDLRVPETRIAQAEMAQRYGIEGFCYWHYWFAGRRLLERPFNEVLHSGEPDYPFCLGWANHPWSAAWIGLPEHILLDQTYPGLEDYKNHFYSVLPAFTDHRYIKVDNKPLFLVFRPALIPDARQFTDCWRQLAEREGLKDIFFIGVTCSPWNRSAWLPQDIGFDAALTTTGTAATKITPEQAAKRRTIGQRVRAILRRPHIKDYRQFVQGAFDPKPLPPEYFPAVMVNWDSTPRHGLRGTVLHNWTAEAFRMHLRDGIDSIIDRNPEHRIVFLKSWNEWAEGNHLEPDQQYGHTMLQVVKDEICAAGLS